MSNSRDRSHVHCPYTKLSGTPEYKYEGGDRRIRITPNGNKSGLPEELAGFRPLELDNVLPYKWICKLVSTTGQGNNNGTGFLVNIPGSSKCVVITARHVLVGATKTDVTFPGRDPITVIWDKFRFLPSVLEQHDYGIIILPDEKSPMEGCGFGFCGTMLDRALLETNLSVFGYPGTQMDLWGSGGKTQSVSDNVLRYLLPTSAGQSGSPVFMWHEGWWTVVGIHISAEQRVEYVINSAVRLNVSVIKQIVTWLGDYQYLDFSFRSDTHFLHIGHEPPSLEFAPLSSTSLPAHFDLIPVHTFPEGSSASYTSVQWVILLRSSEDHKEPNEHASLCVDPYVFGGEVSPLGNVPNKNINTSHIGVCQHLNHSTILRRAPELVNLSTHDGNPGNRAWGVRALRFPELDLRIMIEGWENDDEWPKDAEGKDTESQEDMVKRLSVNITETKAVKEGTVVAVL